MRRTVVRGGEEDRSEGAAKPITEAATRPFVDTSVAGAATGVCRRTSRSSMRAVNPGATGDAQHGAEDALTERAGPAAW